MALLVNGCTRGDYQEVAGRHSTPFLKNPTKCFVAHLGTAWKRFQPIISEASDRSFLWLLQDRILIAVAIWSSEPDTPFDRFSQQPVLPLDARRRQGIGSKRIHILHEPPVRPHARSPAHELPGPETHPADLFIVGLEHHDGRASRFENAVAFPQHGLH